jgi:hypothetical protein
MASRLHIADSFDWTQALPLPAVMTIQQVSLDDVVQRAREGSSRVNLLISQPERAGQVMRLLQLADEHVSRHCAVAPGDGIAVASGHAAAPWLLARIVV